MKSHYVKRKRWDARRPRTPEDEERELSSVLEFDFLRIGSADDLGALWDAEWRNHLLQAAVAKVRTDFSATQFQIFDLNVLKEWPARDVAKSLGVSLASVYLAKHRVSVALKLEMARMERRLEEQAAAPRAERGRAGAESMR